MPIFVLVLAGIGLLFLLQFQFYTESTRWGAPYVPMEPHVVEKLIKLAEITDKDTFYDLGSGDGRVVVAAALKGARAYGIEVNLFRAWYSRFWIMIMGLKSRAAIIHKNYNEVDLSDATVVSLFLLQKTNQNLKVKLEKELKPGTRVVSYAFNFKNWQHEKIDKNSGSIYGPIYLYRAPFTLAK